MNGMATADIEGLRKKVKTLSGFVQDFQELLFNVKGNPVIQGYTRQKLTLNDNLDVLHLNKQIADLQNALKTSTGESVVLGANGFAMSVFDSDANVEVGDGVMAFAVPGSLHGCSVSKVLVAVYTKGVDGCTTVYLRLSRAGTDVNVLTTPVTIYDQYYSENGVISSVYKKLQKGDLLFVDVDGVHSTTAPKGLSVTVSITR